MIQPRPMTALLKVGWVAANGQTSDPGAIPLVSDVEVKKKKMVKTTPKTQRAKY